MTAQQQIQPPAAASRSKRRAIANGWEERAGLLFALPWIVALVLFTILPLLATFFISATKFQISGLPQWVGLANYEKMWADPAFWTSAQNSLTFAVLSVPIKLALALGLALLLSRNTRLSSFYSTVFYLPFMMPVVASSIVFTLLLAPNAGPVNVILNAVGISAPDWLKDPAVALWTLVFISLWPLGVETLVFLGGLKNIPSDVLEAAELDSPYRWHRFVWITIPLITPMILFNLVIGIISSFQIFTQALVMFGVNGEPGESTLTYLVVIYRTAFRYFDMGYAAALATVLFFSVLIVTLLIFRTARSWVYYEGEAR